MKDAAGFLLPSTCLVHFDSLFICFPHDPLRLLIGGCHGPTTQSLAACKDKPVTLLLLMGEVWRSGSRSHVEMSSKWGKSGKPLPLRPASHLTFTTLTPQPAHNPS